MGVRCLRSQAINLQVLCLLVLGCEGSPVTQPISNQMLTETQHFGVRVCPEAHS